MAEIYFSKGIRAVLTDNLDQGEKPLLSLALRDLWLSGRMATFTTAQDPFKQERLFRQENIEDPR